MDGTDVNRLLDASRSAHGEYRRAANTDRPNYPLAEQHVARAADLLQQAHELDPNHRSSGWAAFTVPYEKLMAFYTKYPTLA